MAVYEYTVSTDQMIVFSCELLSVAPMQTANVETQVSLSLLSKCVDIANVRL